ncbi:MAG: hypothetical protein SVQ76_02140 [Candidatus Nanohaloarchaea archaeon]|nr:hypothetical protein [Candidatus Nanohaloarchaea archaeon]
MAVPTSILWFAAGFAAGAVAGIGGIVLYMRYRARKQMQMMEDQMGDLLDQDLELEEER